MPSGNSISRFAKYSHDTAAGDRDATIAPAIISHCGPDDATMPGPTFANSARIGASNATRNGDAMVRPDNANVTSCKNPAMPTVAAITKAASPASTRRSNRIAITAINATLNKSGENAVSTKRCCALSSAIITVTGPANAR